MNERLGMQRATAYCQLKLSDDEVSMRQLLMDVLDDPDLDALHAFTTSLAFLVNTFGRYRDRDVLPLLRTFNLMAASEEDPWATEMNKQWRDGS